MGRPSRTWRQVQSTMDNVSSPEWASRPKLERLTRSHVAKRASHNGHCVWLSFLHQNSCQAEISNLCVEHGIQQHIARLHVSVDNWGRAVVVHVAEPMSNPNCYVQPLGPVQAHTVLGSQAQPTLPSPFPMQPSVQTVILHVLVHEKLTGFARDATQELHNVRVANSPQYPHFCMEFLIELLIWSHAFPNPLHGHVLAWTIIDRDTVNLSRPSLPDLVFLCHA
ncbi:23S rRNA (uracil(1939)-C(5))-methyltransferaseRlmD [Striga asiatica]|uniref:23S rRNA (Uracil(1939)-C(5))-methyltransferaseRlmD n=1 Tax=Striga asiatica TaxID=4170 RepID=A0A5A7QUU1_STRAF|nr:23S rRNA (uracil(1939)-C(5))-methyltransferaseRlmD [Striga asiatica]